MQRRHVYGQFSSRLFEALPLSARTPASPQNHSHIPLLQAEATAAEGYGLLQN